MIPKYCYGDLFFFYLFIFVLFFFLFRSSSKSPVISVWTNFIVFGLGKPGDHTEKASVVNEKGIFRGKNQVREIGCRIVAGPLIRWTARPIFCTFCHHIGCLSASNNFYIDLRIYYYYYYFLPCAKSCFVR